MSCYQNVESGHDNRDLNEIVKENVRIAGKVDGVVLLVKYVIACQYLPTAKYL